MRQKYACPAASRSIWWLVCPPAPAATPALLYTRLANAESVATSNTYVSGFGPDEVAFCTVSVRGCVRSDSCAPCAGDTGLGVVMVVVGVDGLDGLLSLHVLPANAATKMVTAASARFLRFIETP